MMAMRPAIAVVFLIVRHHDKVTPTRSSELSTTSAASGRVIFIQRAHRFIQQESSLGRFARPRARPRADADRL